MAQAHHSDRQPGAPLKVRRMAGGAHAVLIAISSDDGNPARDLLILRWDQQGQVYASLLASTGSK
jgi:hypothetical protein